MGRRKYVFMLYSTHSKEFAVEELFTGRVFLKNGVDGEWLHVKPG